MVGRGGFRGGEVTREIQRSFPDLTLVTLPFDPRVSAAAWDGRVDAGRSYSKSMAAVADVVVRSLR
jgi:hypothetical protein